MTPAAIRHRVSRGRLIPVARGLLAISRPRGADEERWTEAVLRCVPGTLLGDRDAAAHWNLDHALESSVHVSVPAGSRVRLRGVVVHVRRFALSREARTKDRISVTSPALTLIDNADRWGPVRLEAAINKADGMRIVRPDAVRASAERLSHVPGAVLMKRVLDRLTFRLTDSELERIFRRLVADAGLPQPLTQQSVGDHRVDFLWPDLRLVVEADSL